MNNVALTTKISLAVTGLLVAPAYAAELDVSVEIPKLNVAEYHRPYVAIWIEGADGSFTQNLAVWYGLESKDGDHGTKWLPDLRQWWRKSGRTLQVPVDGVTGPTRPAGQHQLKFDAKQLAGLKPGSYQLVVEAVREVGDRELLKVPFDWSGKPQTARAPGSRELGDVALTIK